MPGKKSTPAAKKQGGMNLSTLMVPGTLAALTAALQSTKPKSGAFKGGMQWAGGAEGGASLAPLATAFSSSLKGGAKKKKKATKKKTAKK